VPRRSTLSFIACLVAMPICFGATNPQPSVTVVGERAPRYAVLDSLVAWYMQSHDVPNAELAVSFDGSVVFSHAYTNVGASEATPKTIFRLASNSKAWTSAAIDELMKSKTISGGEHVFDYLGIRDPLPAGAPVADPRVFDITIGELVDHTAGWDRAVAHFDPMHAMRKIAVDTQLGRPVQARDIARYMLAQPLQHAPGSTYAYCNVCYMLLGMVIEKASGQPYLDYVRSHVAYPIGVMDLVLSPTEDPRLPGEVATYASSATGLSPLHLDSDIPVPGPNGGDGEIREVGVAAGGLATSAESMLELMDRYAIWGLGSPPIGRSLARGGSAAGTNSYAHQRPDGVHYAIIVNRRDDEAFDAFHEDIDRALDAIAR